MAYALASYLISGVHGVPATWTLPTIVQEESAVSWALILKSAQLLHIMERIAI
jgi:hypothetical protein